MIDLSNKTLRVIFLDHFRDAFCELADDAQIEIFNTLKGEEVIKPLDQDEFIEKYFCKQSAYGACFDLLDFIDRYGRDSLEKAWYAEGDRDGEFYFWDEVGDFDYDIDFTDFIEDSILDAPENVVQELKQWIDIPAIYADSIKEWKTNQGAEDER